MVEIGKGYNIGSGHGIIISKLDEKFRVGVYDATLLGVTGSQIMGLRP